MFIWMLILAIYPYTILTFEKCWYLVSQIYNEYQVKFLRKYPKFAILINIIFTLN